jgi:hemerythrin-like domain-containing protein
VVVATENLPKPISTLLQEHRYMNLLLETMLEQLQGEGLDTDAGVYLAQDIARYMHEYPDTVHHPTEDIIFNRLLVRDPDSKKDIDWLRKDHERLAAQTAKITDLLDAAVTDPDDDTRAAAETAVKTYIHRLQKHMEVEEAKLFPRAVECLSHTDWNSVNNRVEKVEDPLFGSSVEREYRPLFEYFANRANDMSRGLTSFEFRQFDNVVQSADALERGTADLWKLFSEHAVACFDQSRSTVAEIWEDPSPFAVLGAQLRYARFVGGQAIELSIDAASIWTRTMRSMVAPFLADKAERRNKTV